jgi:hypothetical protein
MAIAVMVAAIPVPIFASDLGPGAITAIVRDTSGRPVSDTLVVAEGPVSRRATTSSGGIVTLLALPIGTYFVRFTRAGFIPLMKRIDVSSDVRASTLQVAIARNSLGLSEGIASSVEAVSLRGDANALVSHALATTRDILLVRAPASQSGVAPALLGTDANETRVELDGIPIAGGAASFAALRFRNVLGLDSVAVQRGPIVTTPTVQNAIGGIIDYRSPDFESFSGSVGETGYSSTFGAFQHVRTTQVLGPLSILADAVTGGGENRTQTLKARLAFSRATGLDLAAYGSQSTSTVDGANVSSVAPAYAFGGHTTVGSAAFAVRAFGSSVDSTGGLADSLGISSLAARIRGVQGSAEFTLGTDTASLSVDKRSDFTTVAQALGNRTLARAYTSVAARTDLTLSKIARLELGDDFSGGTSLARRNDPHVALSFAPSDGVTIRASAGSSYAVAPGELALVAPGGLALAPETAFGYRLEFADDLTGVDRFAIAAFDLRRFDRFATYADARSLGVDLGFAHHPIGEGFGGDADLTLQRASAYGPLSAIDREATILDASSLTQIAGDPYDTLHTRLNYLVKNGAEYGVGATLFGANNALGPRAVGFIDASATVPLSDAGSVLLSINNIAGAQVTDPYLAPYYQTREFTVFFRLGGSKTP